MSDRQQRTNASSEANGPSKESSDIVADWLMLYAAMYREQITPELVLMYQQSLKKFRPQVLHQGFLNATHNCVFRPKVSEVLKEIEIIESRNPSPQGEYRENRFFTAKRPVIDLNRDIVFETMPREEYYKLDPANPADNKKIFDLFVMANRERYRRRGVDPDTWKPIAPYCTMRGQRV